MAIKKLSQEEVNGTLWRACDTFRGKIDSVIYKDYVLVMLFIKYVSDIYKEHKEQMMERYDGDAEMVERQMRYERFVVDERSTFDYIYDKRNQVNVGEIINKILLVMLMNILLVILLPMPARKAENSLPQQRYQNYHQD